VIGAVDGWIGHHGVHMVTLYPPGGGGRIRFLDRRPLMRVAEVVAHVLALDLAFVLTSHGVVTPMITDEGEHGAWITIRGMRDSSAVLRHVGAVFGDQVTAIFDTLVVAPDRSELLESTARRLQQGLSLALGVRRRWFGYTPPVGWTAVPNGLITRWYPPEYPREQTELVVLPAEPSGLDGDAVIGEMARGTESVVEAQQGLSGRYWSYNRHHVAVFVAAPYVYSLRMATDTAERQAVFEQVVRSVMPVPAPHHPVDLSLFSHLVG
jgi:hypothetical protein